MFKPKKKKNLKMKYGIIMEDIIRIWEEDICPITRKAGKEKR